MAHALKLRVHVGKDHVVKLPSDFPEGLVEVVVTTVTTASPQANALGLWSDLSDDEYESFRSDVERLRESDQLRSTDE